MFDFIHYTVNGPAMVVAEEIFELNGVELSTSDLASQGFYKAASKLEALNIAFEDNDSTTLACVAHDLCDLVDAIEVLINPLTDNSYLPDVAQYLIRNYCILDAPINPLLGFVQAVFNIAPQEDEGNGGHIIVAPNGDDLEQSPRLQFKNDGFGKFQWGWGTNAAGTPQAVTTLTPQIFVTATNTDYTPAETNNTTGFWSGLVSTGKTFIKDALDKLATVVANKVDKVADKSLWSITDQAAAWLNGIGTVFNYDTGTQKMKVDLDTSSQNKLTEGNKTRIKVELSPDLTNSIELSLEGRVENISITAYNPVSNTNYSPNTTTFLYTLETKASGTAAYTSTTNPATFNTNLKAIGSSDSTTGAWYRITLPSTITVPVMLTIIITRQA